MYIEIQHWIWTYIIYVIIGKFYSVFKNINVHGCSRFIVMLNIFKLLTVQSQSIDMGVIECLFYLIYTVGIKNTI